MILCWWSILYIFTGSGNKWIKYKLALWTNESVIPVISFNFSMCRKSVIIINASIINNKAPTFMLPVLKMKANEWEPDPTGLNHLRQGCKWRLEVWIPDGLFQNLFVSPSFLIWVNLNSHFLSSSSAALLRRAGALFPWIRAALSS